MTALTVDELLRENEDLRHRLEEAEQAVRAIQAGEVDAVLVEAEREHVLTLERPHDPYRLLVSQVPHPAVTLTPAGSIIYCNRRFADMLERPESTLRGRPLRDIVAPDSHGALDHLLRAGRTAEVQDTVTLLRSNGTPTTACLGVSALREGALGMCLMVTDLTEQQHYAELRQTQQALRESETRLAMELANVKELQRISAQMIKEDNIDVLYGQILDGAMAVMRSDFASMQMLDPGRNELKLLAFRGFNPAAAAFWEWVRPGSGSTCGVALRTGRRVIVPDVDACDFMAGTDDLETYRQTNIRAVQTTPLVSRGGQLLGMISTHWRGPHEPSERDLHLLDVLARQAADLVERRRTEQALREADQRKDEFLATLAHELRNPLAPIRNAAQILSAQGLAAPELQWARGVIDRQVRHMARLLDDLLDVSRISRNSLELRRERVDLAGVVEAAVETSRPVIEGCRHELNVTLPAEPIQLDADPVRLGQVFANLLNNAAKYTSEGGCIRLTAERQGSEVVVSLIDTGIGIAPEMLPRVFDIFARGDQALERSRGGLGIGLSLVKRLVELHGGSIDARSAGPGHGSEFIVRLPVAVDAPVPQPARAGEGNGQQSRPGRRVLIVDDNRDSADSLAMLLQLMGHEVRTAYDGEQAIQFADAMRPDVVLLDIGMPKLNGYDACRHIREQPWGRDMFFVAVTGWGQEQDRRRTEEAGFNYHMVKPVDPSALIDLLASLPEEKST